MPAWAAVAASGGFAAKVGRGAGILARKQGWAGEYGNELTRFGQVAALGAGHEAINAGKRAHRRRNTVK